MSTLDESSELLHTTTKMMLQADIDKHGTVASVANEIEERAQECKSIQV